MHKSPHLQKPNTAVKLCVRTILSGMAVNFATLLLPRTYVHISNLQKNKSRKVRA